MFIRSAFWIGRARPEEEGKLKDIIEERLAPAIVRLPGVANVRVLWPKDVEDSPPSIFCQILIECESREALYILLACPEPRGLRATILKEALSLFEGSVSHINYEVACALSG